MTDNAEHVTDNRLNDIKCRIIAGHDRVEKSGLDWVEGSLEVAAALRDGRDAISADIAFSNWLKTNGLDYYPHQDRAALISLASDLDLARTVLGETDSRSYRLIWEKTKDRFTSAGKPASTKKRRTPNPERARINRLQKLGEATIARISGTLSRADEIDELIVLNRGAEPGKLTDIVAALVDADERGERVSAIKAGAYIKSTGCRDIGAIIGASRTTLHADDRLTEYWRSRSTSSSPAAPQAKLEDERDGEIARFKTEIACLKAEIARVQRENQDLKDEIEELRGRDALTLGNRLEAIAAARAAGRDEFGGLTLKGKERALLQEADQHLDAAESIFRKVRADAGLRPSSKTKQRPTLAVGNNNGAEKCPRSKIVVDASGVAKTEPIN